MRESTWQNYSRRRWNEHLKLNSEGFINDPQPFQIQRILKVPQILPNYFALWVHHKKVVFIRFYRIENKGKRPEDIRIETGA